METRGSAAIKAVITAAIIGALVFFEFIAGNFVPASRAVNAATAMGFTNVKVYDKSAVAVDFRGCSEDDDVLYKMTATNANGKTVHLTGCGGFFFKGITIRIAN